MLKDSLTQNLNKVQAPLGVIKVKLKISFELVAFGILWMLQRKDYD